VRRVDVDRLLMQVHDAILMRSSISVGVQVDVPVGVRGRS
jgi:hypothetical protein